MPIMNLLKKLLYPSLTPDLPRTIMIEPTNACTLKCFMCDYQNQSIGPRSYLTAQSFKSILLQFPRLEGLIFCGIGEPLLNKEICDMICIANKMKISFINLITNGTLLDEKYFTDLLHSGLKRIQISLHAFDHDAGGKINGVSAQMHSLICDNIIKISEINKKSRIKMHITINSVLTRDNYSDVINLMRFCESFGIDEINFAQLTTIFGKYDHLNIDITKAKSLIKKIKKEAQSLRLKVAFLTGNHYGRCHQMWNFMMIHSNGSISPCNGIMPTENISIGNLFKDDILDIWHSNKYRDLRESVVEGFLPNCRHCAEGYLLEGKNLAWLKNHYLKPIARKFYIYAVRK